MLLLLLLLLRNSATTATVAQQQLPQQIKNLIRSTPPSSTNYDCGGALVWGVEYFTAVNRTTECRVPPGQDPEACSRPGHHCCFPGELEQVSRAFRVGRVALEWDIIEGGSCGSTPTRPKGVYGNWTQWDQAFATMQKQNIRQYGLLSLCSWPGNRLYDGGQAPHSPEATDAFVRWFVFQPK